MCSENKIAYQSGPLSRGAFLVQKQNSFKDATDFWRAAVEVLNTFPGFFAINGFRKYIRIYLAASSARKQSGLFLLALGPRRDFLDLPADVPDEGRRGKRTPLRAGKFSNFNSDFIGCFLEYPLSSFFPSSMHERQLYCNKSGSLQAPFTLLAEKTLLFSPEAAFLL